MTKRRTQSAEEWVHLAGEAHIYLRKSMFSGTTSEDRTKRDRDDSWLR